MQRRTRRVLERIADRLQAYAAAGVTTVSLTPYGDTTDERTAMLRAAAEALDISGVGT